MAAAAEAGRDLPQVSAPPGGAPEEPLREVLRGSLRSLPALAGQVSDGPAVGVGQPVLARGGRPPAPWREAGRDGLRSPLGTVRERRCDGALRVGLVAAPPPVHPPAGPPLPMAAPAGSSGAQALPGGSFPSGVPWGGQRRSTCSAWNPLEPRAVQALQGWEPGRSGTRSSSRPSCLLLRSSFQPLQGVPGSGGSLLQSSLPPPRFVFLNPPIIVNCVSLARWMADRCLVAFQPVEKHIGSAGN